MSYQKPNPLTRWVVNPLINLTHAGGAETLTVVGRRSGRSRDVPVIPVRVGESRYLVCPYGQTDWVRNLRAAGRGELRGHGVAEPFVASEVPVAERAPVIDAYRAVAGRVVEPLFRDLPDPADHPVFRIEPVNAPT
ncbi:deazaflavin-dependent oxidoreductase, nitroreductase family [Nakamurella panacisegetis]|uniref:Deazaflavin-dependent oxidoreductase, nitroreductase family n=1 Tax=Nakamurella panacisegetis TaxID=1090615 RepID=A0A1H0QXH2_9ACTN|nr:nitroreductase/quinone reductase family protein [Nakamurella panacisegetis]SDP21944.1 deazaflavin-dependent oxidoreductase, nitroreductase family [Nakamurella panacisegetis]